MNINELTFPVRVYWDLSPAKSRAALDYARICKDILEIKIFNLNLFDAGIPFGRACIEILEKFKNENIAVSLTISGAVLNHSTTAVFYDLNVKTLFIEASSIHELGSIGDKIRQPKKGMMSVGISYAVNQRNYKRLSEVLLFCLENGIERLAFPMQRLIQRNECFFLDKNERKYLSEKANALNHDRLKLTIHDPFLWKVFYPSDQFPGGGCQAANSMVYISPEGSVYPCPSMPILIGDLTKKTLKEILLSPQKASLRKSLMTSPEECFTCKELNQCMGGCRGRAYALKNTLNEPDPACR